MPAECTRTALDVPANIFTSTPVELGTPDALPRRTRALRLVTSNTSIPTLWARTAMLPPASMSTPTPVPLGTELSEPRACSAPVLRSNARIPVSRARITLTPRAATATPVPDGVEGTPAPGVSNEAAPTERACASTELARRSAPAPLNARLTTVVPLDGVAGFVSTSTGAAALLQSKDWTSAALLRNTVSAGPAAPTTVKLSAVLVRPAACTWTLTTPLR